MCVSSLCLDLTKAGHVLRRRIQSHLNMSELTGAFKVCWFVHLYCRYFVEFLALFQFIQNKLQKMLIMCMYKYFKILHCHLQA